MTSLSFSQWMHAIQMNDIEGFQNGLNQFPEFIHRVSHDQPWTSTPLTLAADRGHDLIVHALIEAGADFNAQSSLLTSPLIRASIQGHYDVVQILLDYKADLHLNDRKGYTALHWACYEGHLHVVNLLVEKGAIIDALSHCGYSPLMCACFNGHSSIVDFLIQQNAHLFYRSDNDYDVLMHAVSSGWEDVVHQLIRTPLMNPPYQRHPSLLEIAQLHNHSVLSDYFQSLQDEQNLRSLILKSEAQYDPVRRL